MAAINLDKGQKIDLDKVDADLKRLRVGLGWKERNTTGEDFDLDASAFMLGANGKVAMDNHFIFYHKHFMVSPCGSVKHMGDNKIGGSGDEDVEQIEIDLTKVPVMVSKIVLAVTIYKGAERKQNFGMVNDTFARIVNQDTGKEVIRFNLTEKFSTETAMLVMEIYRYEGSWRVGGVGQGFAGGLNAMAQGFGLDTSGG
jgi:tellurium resistance protein TerD